MEDGEGLGGSSDCTYNKLVSQEDLSDDEQHLYPNQEKKHVSMIMESPVSSWNQYKRLIVSLVGLAVILLAVDIGLGVYYNKLTDGQHIITEINGELAKLQAAYSAAKQRQEEAIKLWAKENSDQQLTKWELDHQSKGSKDFEKQADKLRTEVASLKSHVPMLKEGCRHCLSGWTYMNSGCYFFPFSDTISMRSWQDARQFCRRFGGDLAVVDTRDKNMAISKLLNHYQDPSRPIAQTGHWIGLTDIAEEGTWKWLDGTRVTESYWNNGEPNNLGNEDCGAAYPRDNPFMSWNDAPCSYNLKWICEMTPKTAS